LVFNYVPAILLGGFLIEWVNMKNILAALPEEKIVERIYKIRQDIINKGWGVEDARKKVLPHTTLSYLKAFDGDERAEKIITELSKEVKDLKSFQIKVVGAEIWEKKISLMLDNFSFRDLIVNADRVFRKHDISWNDEYLLELNKKKSSSNQQIYNNFEEAIGDHIKIVRNVFESHLVEAQKYILKNLPQLMIFDKLVLMGYGCTEKDIFWKADL